MLTHHSILLLQKPSLLLPYWNTLLHRPTKNWAGTGLYALRLSGIISCRCKVFQYGVLSSLFMPAIVNSTRTPYIVGLVRLCLGSTMTSSDLPPDLHSNHIFNYYRRNRTYYSDRKSIQQAVRIHTHDSRFVYRSTPRSSAFFTPAIYQDAIVKNMVSVCRISPSCPVVHTRWSDSPY